MAACTSGDLTLEISIWAIIGIIPTLTVFFPITQLHIYSPVHYIATDFSKRSILFVVNSLA